MAVIVLGVMLLTGAALVPGQSARAAGGFQALPDAPIGEAAVHEITLVLVAPGGEQPNFTLAQATRAVEQVNDFYEHETDGFVRFSVAHAVDWTPLPDVACTDFSSVNAFSERISGFQRGPNRHLLTLVPGVERCGGTAFGGQGGTVNSGELVFQPGVDPTTIAHELGHNMSIAHASSVACPTSWDYDNRSTRPASCAFEDYGDLYDNMGGGYSFWPSSPGTLDRLGMIDNKLVPVCGAPRTAVISTLSAGYTKERIISWTDPTAPSTKYYVAYRDSIDNEAYRNVYRQSGLPDDYHTAGVTISKTSPAHGGLSAEVLERPGDRSDRRQLIQPAEKLSLAGGATVSVDSFDEAAHTATVTVNVPCSTLPDAPVATASYTSLDASVSGVNDGDRDVGGWWSWPQVGETWVQLTWDEEVEVNSASVVFAADARDDENRGLIPPKSWQLQRVNADGEWVPIETNDALGRLRDTANTADFRPVRTTAVRIVMQAWGAAEYGGSSGIREFQVSALRIGADPTDPDPVEPGVPAQPAPSGPLVPDRQVSSGAAVVASSTSGAQLAETGTGYSQGLTGSACLLVATGALVLVSRRLRRRGEARGSRRWS